MCQEAGKINWIRITFPIRLNMPVPEIAYEKRSCGLLSVDRLALFLLGNYENRSIQFHLKCFVFLLKAMRLTLYGSAQSVLKQKSLINIRLSDRIIPFWSSIRILFCFQVWLIVTQVEDYARKLWKMSMGRRMAQDKYGSHFIIII